MWEEILKQLPQAAVCTVAGVYVCGQIVTRVVKAVRATNGNGRAGDSSASLPVVCPARAELDASHEKDVGQREAFRGLTISLDRMAEAIVTSSRESREAMNERDKMLSRVLEEALKGRGKG